ncbi:MAG: tRNA (N6-threonylcarbamoyladenosine(37)-N6)-methyltransferase TrmO [Acutalibacteraceae bacterium]|nr:tRNA (N6-threonylcarbamoyladenosine(37)-N6)-methyltransferase TrmO [Acutalibacteraceae bacterium]
MEIKPIAHIHTDFKEKFGIPRQSGRVDAEGIIIFEEEYRVAEALRGIEEYSHLWLIFDFSENHREEWSPTVRPPRLGGNTHIGVFATRSPFRPNNLGLSCVKLKGVEKTQKNGIILRVSGVDMLDNTPIYDIKPYIPYYDCKEGAKGSFGENFADYSLDIADIENKLSVIPEEKRKIAINCLCEDIRPSYQNDPERIYKWLFADFEIAFKVENKTVKIIDVI